MALTRLIFLASGIFAFVFAIEESRVLTSILFSVPDYSFQSELASDRISAITMARIQRESNARTATSSLVFSAEKLGIYDAKDGIMKISGVPFVAQSPLGEWGHPVFRNACEEASIIMAHYWREGIALTPKGAREEILKIAEFETKMFGFHSDTSIADTARVARAYFGYVGIRVRESIGVSDILDELSKGNLVIIPVNGKILSNPNFEPPGPVQHMIVVVGYDFTRNEFITNDPGTRVGKDFRYSYDTIEAALQDYVSAAEHQALPEGKRAMIVVEPKYEGRFDG